MREVIQALAESAVQESTRPGTGDSHHHDEESQGGECGWSREARQEVGDEVRGVALGKEPDFCSV